MSIIKNLSKHILVDGFHIVVDQDKSQESWVVDIESQKTYLDCYSQFASQALGWNHEALDADLLGSHAKHKLANSDMYSHAYAGFVQEFAKITPDFKYFFFVEGGSVAVENALKAAFDWKCQMSPRLKETDGTHLDVIHFKEAFHGRTGYTLSLTNTGELKTKWFPKFSWTRVPNPKINFPLNEKQVAKAEEDALYAVRASLAGKNVAAIIIEPIQGEGGDNHFRQEFFVELRKLADAHETLLIFDEIQTGVGLTGKMWCYEHFGVVPDLMCFGKKTQVCGFCSTDRIESAPENVFKKSGRINSTWGGNIVDMVRATHIFRTIEKENLVENAREVGAYFLERLNTITSPDLLNVRGRGLMIAFDLPTVDYRDYIYGRLSEKMLMLKCGTRSIRFRPHLTFTKENVDLAVGRIDDSLTRGRTDVRNSNRKSNEGSKKSSRRTKNGTK